MFNESVTELAYTVELNIALTRWLRGSGLGRGLNTKRRWGEKSDGEIWEVVVRVVRVCFRNMDPCFWECLNAHHLR